MGMRHRDRAVNEKPSASHCAGLRGPSSKIHPTPASPTSPRLGCKQRRDILAAYERVLGLHSSTIKPASTLPYPKELIRQAIVEELVETVEGEERTNLEISYSQLEVFLESRDFDLVEKFARMELAIDQLARSGNPLDLLAAGQLVRQFPGDKVVGIFQRVSKQMHARISEVRRMSTQPTA